MSPFGISKSERTTVFIDGQNLYAAAKAMGADVDYSSLRDHFRENCALVRLNYYTSILDNSDEGHITIQPLIDWLSYNGYNVITKDAKEFTNSMGQRKIKGGMVGELSIGMVDASEQRMDHIVLFSGDGDYLAAVDACKRRGCRVSVIAMQSITADELRRAADQFIDLSKVFDMIRRAPREAYVQRPQEGPMAASLRTRMGSPR